MLIGSYFKRPNTPIDIEGVQYFFRPIDPANPDSPHVCEVANGRHAQRFLGITEGYYIPDSDTPAPVANRPTPNAPPPAPPAGENAGHADPAASASTPTSPSTETGDQGGAPPPAATATTDDAGGDAAADAEEIAQAAAKLIEPHWQKVLSLVKGGGIPQPVLKEALRLEQGKSGEDEPRQSVVKALQAALAS